MTEGIVRAGDGMRRSLRKASVRADFARAGSKGSTFMDTTCSSGDVETAVGTNRKD